MKIKIMKIDEDIKEQDFPKYLKELGYSCKKIKGTKHKSIEKLLGVKFKIGKGMPDFIVYNKKDKFLCEFKSLTDGWRACQIEWAINNPDVPLTLAFVLPKKGINNNYYEIDMDDEYDKQSKKANDAWKVKNKMLNEYVWAHPKLIGNTLFRDNRFLEEGYLGQIPEEVSRQWDDFDKQQLNNTLMVNILETKG